MKQYLTGFFMAWGNFCALPCPCKRWDTNATPLMLGFLPSVGVIIGAIWAVLYFAAVYFGLPYRIFVAPKIHLNNFHIVHPRKLPSVLFSKLFRKCASVSSVQQSSHSLMTMRFEIP